LHARIVRYGAAAHLKAREPSPPATRIELPPWSIPRVADASSAIVDGIGRSGVAVIGDLSTLGLIPGPSTEPADPGTAETADRVESALMSPDVAAALSAGILVAAGIAPRDQRVGDLAADRSPALDVPTYQVAGTIAIRGQRIVMDGLRRVRRAVRFSVRRPHVTRPKS
jgi:hypothetical protein